MKVELAVIVSDEQSGTVKVAGGVNITSEKFGKLVDRVIAGIDDPLTKEITIQAIVAELMLNPAEVVDAMCKGFAANLYRYVPIQQLPEIDNE